MSIIKRRFSVESVWWFICLFFFFSTPFIERYPVINNAYIILRGSSLVFLMTRMKQAVRVDAMICLIFLSQAVVFVSTCSMGAPTGSLISKWLNITVFCLTISIMMKEDAERCLNILCVIFEIMVYVNFITMVLFFDEGLYDPQYVGFVETRKYFFLGHQNGMNIYAMTAITLRYVILLTNKNEADIQANRKRLAVLSAVTVIYSVLVWSAMSILCSVALLSLFFIDRSRTNGLRIPIFVTLTVNLVLFVFLTIVQNVPVLNAFVVNVLHRDMTFSGRTTIWRLAYNEFLKHPVIGVGYGQGRKLFGFDSAHNKYMHTLFTGGIVGLLILISIFLLLDRCLRNTGEPAVRVILLFFVVFLFSMQDESYETLTFYVMIIVGYNVAGFIKDETVNSRELSVDNNS